MRKGAVGETCGMTGSAGPSVSRYRESQGKGLEQEQGEEKNTG